MENDETDDALEYLQCMERRFSLFAGDCTIADCNLKSMETEEDRGENLKGWGVLPDLVLEKVFGYLDIPRRYTASMVCRQWQKAFYLQGSWDTFQLEDNTLTRHKFNYYMGWQLILDHLRTQMCIFRVGRFIRNLVISPMSNLFNLYEFMNLLSCYSERYNEDARSRAPLHIQSFRFVFRCDLAPTEEQSVYGTGGKLLEGLKRLMTNLNDLLSLELIDLLLDSRCEALHLLDDVCAALCGRLERLVLINPTRAPLSFIHPACFINLRILKLSPQNIGEEVVELLCDNLQLEELHLIQNNYTELGGVVGLGRHAWKKAKFRVFLRTIGKTHKDLIWQEGAPVTSVIYDCPNTKVDWGSILTVVDLYANKLEEYGHVGLGKFWRSKKFVDRSDCLLLTISRKCPHLTTLYVRERMSASTLLLIVSLSASRNLRNLFVRRNALILKCDYRHHNLELDVGAIEWIQANSKSYEKMTREVATLIGQWDWKPLTDAKFKEISNLKKAY